MNSFENMKYFMTDACDAFIELSRAVNKFINLLKLRTPLAHQILD